MTKSTSKLNRFFWLLVAVIILTPSLFFVNIQKEPEVLMYHFVRSSEEVKTNPLAVSKETFVKQIHDLKAWGYRFYSLDEFYEIKTGKVKAHQKGVVLTFDDGNQDFYETIFPILNESKVQAAQFLVWNSMAKHENGSMSLDEVKELAKNPLVTFGVHTTSHKILVNLTDKELNEEIIKSKQNFEKALHVPMKYFAYPGGHFDDASRQKVEDAGYEMAFTTSRKRLQGSEENFSAVPRVKITEKDKNPVLFWLKVSGIHSLADKLKLRAKSGKPSRPDTSNSAE